jgi:hypothetical protein
MYIVISDVKRGETHTGELLVSEPSPFEVETAIANLKYKSSGVAQILAELIQVGQTLCSEIHKFIRSIYE